MLQFILSNNVAHSSANTTWPHKKSKETYAHLKVLNTKHHVQLNAWDACFFFPHSQRVLPSCCLRRCAPQPIFALRLQTASTCILHIVPLLLSAAMHWQSWWRRRVCALLCPFTPSCYLWCSHYCRVKALTTKHLTLQNWFRDAWSRSSFTGTDVDTALSAQCAIYCFHIRNNGLVLTMA